MQNMFVQVVLEKKLTEKQEKELIKFFKKVYKKAAVRFCYEEEVGSPDEQKN